MNKANKSLSLILAICMMLTMLPFNALSTSESEQMESVAEAVYTQAVGTDIPITPFAVTAPGGSAITTLGALQTALGMSSTGGTATSGAVNLTDNVTLNATISISGGEFVINGNGYTVSATSGDTWTSQRMLEIIL